MKYYTPRPVPCELGEFFYAFGQCANEMRKAHNTNSRGNPRALNQWREIGTRKNAGEMHNLNTKGTLYEGNRGERVRFFYSDRHLLINRQPLRHGKAVILQHE